MLSILAIVLFYIIQKNLGKFSQKIPEFVLETCFLAKFC